MNRGRHKKNNISEVNNTKEYLLLSYNAKDLNKWKYFSLEELKCLIKETSKQQENYIKKVNLSIYERDWCAGRLRGGIDWHLTEEGYSKWYNLMITLRN